MTEADMDMRAGTNIENHEDLFRYLKDSGRIAPEERPVAETLTGGISNRTVLMRRSSSEAWVLKQALEKLRTTVEWFSDPRRIEREARGMEALGRWLPEGSVPRLIFLDEKNHILAMEAVPEPHRNWKDLLLESPPSDAHIAGFAALLAALHRNSASDPEAAKTFADRSFFETLRLEPYYGYAAEQVPEAADFLRQLIAVTRRTARGVVHGDFSPKNVLVRGDRLVLLDHEVIHFGDTAFDVGFSLTHLLSKAHHFRERRAVFAQAALRYWSLYLEAAGPAASVPEFREACVRHTLGCLLARVAGRSPLEYLNHEERLKQGAAATALISSPPRGIPELIESFLQRV